MLSAHFIESQRVVIWDEIGEDLQAPVKPGTEASIRTRMMPRQLLLSYTCFPRGTECV